MHVKYNGRQKGWFQCATRVKLLCARTNTQNRQTVKPTHDRFSSNLSLLI